MSDGPGLCGVDARERPNKYKLLRLSDHDQDTLVRALEARRSHLQVLFADLRADGFPTDAVEDEIERINNLIEGIEK